MGRVATSLLGMLAACGQGNDARGDRASTRVEAAIARGLGARVGVAVVVRCAWLPPRCTATLPDRSTLPIALTIEHGALAWHLAGALLLADDIEAYLRATLADLGAPQVARCGVRIRSVAPDDRIECQLQHGGKAFVVVNADLTTTTEILLDPVAGDARAEPISVERDDSLLQMSRKLEHADEAAEPE